MELATRAGDQVGCDLVEELTMELPLAVPETGGLQLQLAVGEADAAGRRSLALHSRPEAGPDAGDAEAEPWTRHATGTLAPSTASASAEGAGFDLSEWPPREAEAVGIDGLYEEFAAADVRYGPAFQGLRSVWRRGDEVFAEVGIPEEHRKEADRFGLHPVLLDAALQAAHLASDTRTDDDVRDATEDDGGPARPGSRSRGATWPCTPPGRRPCGFTCRARGAPATPSRCCSPTTPGRRSRGSARWSPARSTCTRASQHGVPA